MANQQNVKRADVFGLEPEPTQDDASAERGVRLASTFDEPVASPVQTLTERLERELSEADLPGRWPLAVSAPLWIATSGLLWFGIVKGVLALVHR